MGYKIPGRAYTPEEKKQVINRLLAAWNCAPQLRLGQLLDSAHHVARTSLRPCADFFSIEDEDLCKVLEDFTKRL